MYWPDKAPKSSCSRCSTPHISQGLRSRPRWWFAPLCSGLNVGTAISLNTASWNICESRLERRPKHSPLRRKKKTDQSSVLTQSNQTAVYLTKKKCRELHPLFGLYTCRYISNCGLNNKKKKEKEKVCTLQKRNVKVKTPVSGRKAYFVFLVEGETERGGRKHACTHLYMEVFQCERSLSQKINSSRKFFNS